MGLTYTDNLFGVGRCWLSPKGKVVTDWEYYEGNAFHEEIAMGILMDHFGYESKSDFMRFWAKESRKSNHMFFYDYLEEELGWIRLHGFEHVEKAVWVISRVTKITFAQKQKIRLWCKENGVTWDWAVDIT